MTNLPKIDVRPEHYKIIQQILFSHLPHTASVYAFGSRVTNTAKRFSDLDLLIDIGKPLSLEILSCLTDDFIESNLPYKVDVVDFATISPAFLEKIQNNIVPFKF